MTSQPQDKLPTKTRDEIILQQARELDVDQVTCVPWYSTRLIDFDLSYVSTPPNCLQSLVERILDQCIAHLQNDSDRAYSYGRGTKKVLRAYVRTLVLNLWQNTQLIKTCAVHLSVSLDRNDYVFNSGKEFGDHSYSYFKAIYNAMHSDSLGYIDVLQEGYAGFNKPAKGTRTRIDATEKLLAEAKDAIGEATLETKHKDIKRKGIVLRNEEKESINYKDDVDTRRMSRNLRKINKLIASANISVNIPDDRLDDFMTKLENNENDEEHTKPYVDFSAITLRRIFSNGSLTQGGRFYGVWWQSIPSKKYNYRAHILIDKEETIELDYSRMHPTILYHDEGHDLDFDPYVPLDSADRDSGKKGWNALLNTTRYKPKQPDNYKPIEERTGINWQSLLDALMEHNKPISHRLMTGHGIYMQYTDSVIAEKVLLKLYKDGIVCLPVHDSFIVKRQYKEILESAMKDASMEVLGITLDIDVK